MAAPTSGLFVATILDIGDTTQLTIDLDLDTHKVALFTNSLTGTDLTADTAYGVAPWNANEVPNGSGYTTAGAAFTGTTYTHAGSGVVMWDGTDPSWAGATFVARGGLYYADALAGNNSIFWQTFGADITATGGTFLVTLAAGGVFSVDWVP